MRVKQAERQEEQETIAAVATPPGEGGVAVVRLSGRDALTIAARIFRPARPGDAAKYASHTAHYGQFYNAQTGEIADDGLLTLFRGPRSYTGEDVAELSCHGGRVTTASVLRLTLEAGARLATPGEFTLRAFLNGRMDLAQAEAVADVIRARTDAAQRLARRQLDGALSQAVTALRDELIGILAAIEVSIDFSEETGELDYDLLTPRLGSARRGVARLMATAEQGRILRDGLRVAIVGRPNVGKSSLLNALLRADRAIVTPIAGTTRDALEESANLAGLPVALTDTAGICETEDTVERIGVARARAAAAQADVVLFVLDAAGVTAEDRAILRSLREEQSGEAGARIVLAANKRDAASDAQVAAVLAECAALAGTPDSVAAVSALTGAGLAELETRLTRKADTGAAPDAALVSNARHREALRAALGSLTEAERTARLRLPGDFIAIDVRGATDAIGQITGETATEDIIHRIFQDFCVGK